MYKVLTGCPGCGMCKSVCPVKAIQIKKQAVIDPDKCINCGICASACSVNLIKQDDKNNIKPLVKPVERKIKDGEKDER